MLSLTSTRHTSTLPILDVPSMSFKRANSGRSLAVWRMGHIDPRRFFLLGGRGASRRSESVHLKKSILAGSSCQPSDDGGPR